MAYQWESYLCQILLWMSRSTAWRTQLQPLVDTFSRWMLAVVRGDWHGCFKLSEVNGADGTTSSMSPKREELDGSCCSDVLAEGGATEAPSPFPFDTSCH